MTNPDPIKPWSLHTPEPLLKPSLNLRSPLTPVPQLPKPWSLRTPESFLKPSLNPVSPQTLVPQLPKPRDLKPYPSQLAIRFTGHTGKVGHAGLILAINLAFTKLALPCPVNYFAH